MISKASLIRTSLVKTVKGVQYVHILVICIVLVDYITVCSYFLTYISNSLYS